MGKLFSSFFCFIYFLAPTKLKKRMDLLKHGWSLMVSPDSWLVQVGYVNSFISGTPMDSFNNPLPWMNYGLLAFLKERLNKNMKVFEYGSGNSTLFFAYNVAFICSVEYDRSWFKRISEEIKTNKIDNIEYFFCELGQTYIDKIKNLDLFFDIVIIDGRQRVKCAIASYEKLDKLGIVLLDDSNRERYYEIFDFYKAKGFSFITFSSLKPNGFGIEYSTIFYRKEHNILGL